MSGVSVTLPGYLVVRFAPWGHLDLSLVLPVKRCPVILTFSDRLEGIVPTVGCAIRLTSSPLNIISIGEEDTNRKVHDHFKDRTESLSR